MMSVIISDFVYILPEIFLVFSCLCILPLGVLFHNFSKSIGGLLSVQISIICGGSLFLFLCLILNSWSFEGSIFNFAVEKGLLTNYVSVLLTLGALGIFCFWSMSAVEQDSFSFELPILFLISLLGSYLIILSNDFLTAYLGIELQGLCLYVMAAFKTNSSFSTEAGVKYFVLGGLASSFIIFGISLVYGFTGLANFIDLKYFFLSYSVDDTFGVVNLGFFFILVGLLFKVGGAPFHAWLPDVYEGAPMIVTAFFAIVPKISVFFLLLKLSFNLVGSEGINLNSLLLYSCILSTLVGSIGALAQDSLKRLISYSAIAQTGFLLLGIGTNSFESVTSVIFYLSVYLLLLLNIFACVVGSNQKLDFTNIQLISNLKYLGKSNSVLKYFLALSIFSLAGIPPLSGFFSKFFVFLGAIGGGNLFPAGVVLVISVVSMVYYLRVIRSLVFVKNHRQWMFMSSPNRTVSYVIVYTGLVNLLFLLGLDLILSYIYSLSFGIGW